MEPAPLREPAHPTRRSSSASRPSPACSPAPRSRSRCPRPSLRKLFAVLLLVVAARLAWRTLPRAGATLTRRDPPRRARRRGPRPLDGAGRRQRLRREAPPTGANAVLVRITIPGQDTVSLGELTWPTNVSADVQSFQYPGRRLDRAASDARAPSSRRSRARRPSSQAFAEAIVLSLFGGRGHGGAGDGVARPPARASAPRARTSRRPRCSACARSGRTSRRRAGCERVALRLGLALGARRGQRQRVAQTPSARRRSVVALRVRLDRRPRRPAGRERDRGRQRAGRRRRDARRATPRRPGRVPPRRRRRRTRSLPTAPEPDDDRREPFPAGPCSCRPEVTARLSAGGYVFPIFGPASFGDSFGAPRAGIPGGWHHGEDIFAPDGRAAPRGRRRHDPHGRLQPARRLPPLAARHVRQRVLLRAPLRVHAARDRGQAASRRGT